MLPWKHQLAGQELGLPFLMMVWWRLLAIRWGVEGSEFLNPEMLPINVDDRLYIHLYQLLLSCNLVTYYPLTYRLQLLRLQEKCLFIFYFLSSWHTFWQSLNFLPESPTPKVLSLIRSRLLLLHPECFASSAYLLLHMWFCTHAPVGTPTHRPRSRTTIFDDGSMKAPCY